MADNLKLAQGLRNLPASAREDLAGRAADIERGKTVELLRRAGKEMYENPIVNTAIGFTPVLGDIQAAGETMAALNRGAPWQETAGYAAGMLPFVPMIGKTAWHGSPHFFNKFDIEKLGAGEGNQVYGVGAGYTAEARPVAEGYRKRLSSIGDPYTYEYAGQTFFDPQMYQGKMPADPTSHAVRLAYHQNPSVARQVAKEGLADARAGKPYALEMGGSDYYQKMLDVAKGLKKSDIKAQQGFLYKGDVPDEIIPKMLDWDNPVPDELRQSLSQKAMEQWGSGVTGTSGEKLYKEIVKNFEWAGSQNPMLDASNWLQEQGMTGIKYFDAGSRKKAQGTQNFIPFSPEHFKIEEINDKPLSYWEAQGMFGAPNKLESLNPTGTVMTNYNPAERASLPLGKNLTTLDVTAGVSPDEMVEIYRGVPQGVSEISPGDFITTNRQLAQDYAGGGNVISQKVPYRTILDDLTEPLGEEYIYRP